MSISDPVADLLTRIRNASLAGLKYAVIPASKLKIELVKLLESEGFVDGFRLIRDSGQGKIKLALKYTELGKPVIKGLHRVSKPGCRTYKKRDEYATVRGGLGVALVSTSKGVVTDSTAKKLGVGGEVLAVVW
jgi:small subunit ribosomal protein S8